jgi:uncharacterized protein (UPF0332 family)
MQTIFLTKAKKNIQAAQLLFDNQMYDESANRAYYAVFQAALAALSAAGFQTERISHEAVQAMFNGELIQRRKIYPSHLKSYRLDLQAVRNDADYKLTFISKKVASRQIKKAKEFVERIEQESNK